MEWAPPCTPQNLDIAAIFLKAGLGAAGLIIFIASTVTTTFLDTYSAGVSAASISSKFNAKKVAVFVCVIGTALAILAPIEQFEKFSVSDRICICTYDRCYDCRLFSAEAGFFKGILQYQESDPMGCGIYHLPYIYEN